MAQKLLVLNAARKRQPRWPGPHRLVVLACETFLCIALIGGRRNRSCRRQRHLQRACSCVQVGFTRLCRRVDIDVATALWRCLRRLDIDHFSELFLEWMVGVFGTRQGEGINEGIYRDIWELPRRPSVPKASGIPCNCNSGD